LSEDWKRSFERSGRIGLDEDVDGYLSSDAIAGKSVL
jgi:hypothetical protein